MKMLNRALCTRQSYP